MSGLTNQEIAKIVNRYIGVSNGYLGDFSYSTHAQFYPHYCDLDIDPYNYEGTTRARFIEILSSQSPVDQAKILRGVLERFPLDSSPERNLKMQNEIRAIIARLESKIPVSSSSPVITSQIVQQAISDGEVLLKANGAVSAFDRIHTAIHGYLKEVCNQYGVTYAKDDTITRLLKLLKQQHPNLKSAGQYSQETERILNAISTTLDALNTLRNNASLVHPNENLLQEEDAMLAINASRTILHYLDAKLR